MYRHLHIVDVFDIINIEFKFFSDFLNVSVHISVSNNREKIIFCYMDLEKCKNDLSKGRSNKKPINLDLFKILQKH